MQKSRRTCSSIVICNVLSQVDIIQSHISLLTLHLSTVTNHYVNLKISSFWAIEWRKIIRYSLNFSFSSSSSPLYVEHTKRWNEFAWSQTITIKWSGRVQLSVLVAARNGMKQVKWMRRGKNYWRPCLCMAWDIMLSLWRKIGRKGNAQIFARLFKSSRSEISLCVCFVCSAQLSDFFQLHFFFFFLYY